ncbi:MAG: SAM-dependent methyltransferase, partial [Clostridia bacterium]|nr:SAM-dependent methyltransferase [Clostridia bacterium]
MQKLLGAETPAFLRALDEPPALALRLNPKRRGAEAASAAFIDGPVPWA